MGQTALRRAWRLEPGFRRGRRGWGVVVAAALLATPAAAQLTPAQLATAVARPPAGARLPADLPFTDQRGTPVTLGRVADGRPLVLLFADYTCRHLCAPAATLTADALGRTGLTAGQDYGLAVIGLDPHDTLADARAFAPHLARGAALLTGTPAAIAAAERTLGYGTAYDAQADQWAHDASVYVFAPDGRFVTLLPELGLRPAALKAALAGTPPPSLGERIAHLCYGFAAAHGRFGAPVVLATQALALITVAGLALFAWQRRAA